MVRPIDLLQSEPPQLRLPSSAVSDRIPGLKTSATFFTSLRTNLHLHYDIPSPMSTPPSMRGSTTSLPPPSPLASAMLPPSSDPTFLSPSHSTSNDQLSPSPSLPPFDDPFAGIPPLSTTLATTSADLLSALRLITDSIAQQRQLASRILIFHPLNLGIFGVLLAVIAQLVLKYRGHGDKSWLSGDMAMVMTTCAGIVMCALVGVRLITKGYIEEAESVRWDFVGGEPGKRQGVQSGNGNGEVGHARKRSGSDPNARDVLVTKFGDEVIGALVLEWVVGEGKGRRKKVGKGSIRAWTVKLRYRGKGVGTGLLEEAVALVEKRGGDGIEFNEEHANSKRILPSLYNGPLDKREQKARDLLEDIVDSRAAQSRRR
ncbi:MAG: hypothetical protein M1820_001255 [Bogoriella megaspora]|nr:MAG: hypothetical protein M1820_001255 [Bogoriella megaspora]